MKQAGTKQGGASTHVYYSRTNRTGLLRIDARLHSICGGGVDTFSGPCYTHHCSAVEDAIRGHRRRGRKQDLTVHVRTPIYKLGDCCRGFFRLEATGKDIDAVATH